MRYIVFMDTNIYHSINYCFNNEAIKQLVNFSKQGILELRIDAVVEGEVRRHIIDNVGSVVASVDEILQKRYIKMLYDNPDFSKRLKGLHTERWVNEALSQFNIFLVNCKVKRISTQCIDAGKIIQDYFEGNLPFQQKKKEEFPDAMIIQSIFGDIRELSAGNNYFVDQEIIYCVISNDFGLREGLKELIGNRPNEDVIFFNKLGELISFINSQNDMISELQQKVEKGFLSKIIMESISEMIRNADIVIDENDGLVDSYEIYESMIKKYDSYVTGVQSFSDSSKAIQLLIYADVDLNINYEFMNVSKSYWDKEEDRYLWEVYTQKDCLYNVGVSLSIAVKVNDDKEVEFQDYLDEQCTIELDENDIVKVISVSDDE